MNGKTLAASLFLSSLLLTGCQTQTKQSVQAETKETFSLQQESQVSVSEETETTAPILVSSQPADSTTASETSVMDSEASSTQAAASTESQAREETMTTTIPKESTDLPEIAEVLPAPTPVEKVEENYQFSVVKNQTTEEFIQRIGKDAQQIAWEEGLYASVMIAQAILETGSGNSQLARPPYHNLFGIKGSYQGKQVRFNTQEDTGNGNLYTIQAAFRQYPSYKESLADYAALLKKGLSGNPGFYQATWKDHAATYQEATKALTGKYATDTAYDKKLNALIETYELTRYDQALEVSNAEINEPLIEEKQEPTSTATSTEARDNLTIEETRPGATYETKVPVQGRDNVAQKPARQVLGTNTVK